MISRYVNFFTHKTNVKTIHEHVILFYKTSETDPKYFGKLLKVQKKSGLVTKVFLHLNFLGFILPITSTIVKYFITGQQETLSPIFLPFTNLSSSLGYLLNSFFLLLLSVLAFFGFSTHDGTFLIYGYQCIAFVEILLIKVKELSEFISEEVEQVNHFKGVRRNLKIVKKLKEIMKLHNDYQIFKNLISDFGGLPSFVAIFVNVIAVCLSIIGALKVTFIGGIAAALGFFFQMAIPCLIGNLISLQNEKFINAIYAIPWYELDENETKKMICQLLIFSQNSGSIELPILSTLDNELLAKILNAIYSYCTALLSLLKTAGH